MGVCAFDEGYPITLVFDCISLGIHEIKTKDGLRLKRILENLSKIIQIPTSKIGNVLYLYEALDKNKTIKELGLASGSVLIVKLKP